MQSNVFLLAGIMTLLFCSANLAVLGQLNKDGSQGSVQTIEWDQTFVRAEKMPSFKNGFKALADTLKRQLPDSILNIPQTQCLFTLIIAKSGEVVKIEPKTEAPIRHQLIEALKHTKWIPARQNGYNVNCYKSIWIKLGDKKLKVEE